MTPDPRIISTSNVPLLLVVPYWITNQLKRNNLPPETILDLEKLSTVCSMEDLCVLYQMNTDTKYANLFFGMEMDFGSCLHGIWSVRYERQLNRLKDTLPLISNDVDGRITDTSTHVAAMPYEIMVVGDTGSSQSVIVVIINQGHFGGESDTLKHTVVREALKQCYVFTDYAALATTPLFMRHVQTTISEPA